MFENKNFNKECENLYNAKFIIAVKIVNEPMERLKG